MKASGKWWVVSEKQAIGFQLKFFRSFFAFISRLSRGILWVEINDCSEVGGLCKILQKVDP